MHPPIYRYDQSSKRLFFDLVRRTTGVAFTEDDVHVSPPRALGRNHTEVILSPTHQSPLTGSVPVTYNRLDLSLFFFGVPLSFEGLDDPTPANVSARLREQWGVWVDPDHLLVTVGQAKPHHPTPLTLTATESALAWVGSVDAWALPGTYLGTVFQDTPLSFNVSNTKQNAYLYSQDRTPEDFTVGLLKAYGVGDVIHTLTVDTQRLITALQASTGDDWVIAQHTAPFNLNGAEVIYHGEWDPDHPGRRVVVLHLGRACQNLFGHLLLYYDTALLSDILHTTDLHSFE